MFQTTNQVFNDHLAGFSSSRITTMRSSRAGKWKPDFGTRYDDQPVNQSCKVFLGVSRHLCSPNSSIFSDFRVEIKIKWGYSPSYHPFFAWFFHINHPAFGLPPMTSWTPKSASERLQGCARSEANALSSLG